MLKNGTQFQVWNEKLISGVCEEQPLSHVDNILGEKYIPDNISDEPNDFVFVVIRISSIRHELGMKMCETGSG